MDPQIRNSGRRIISRFLWLILLTWSSVLIPTRTGRAESAGQISHPGSSVEAGVDDFPLPLKYFQAWQAEGKLFPGIHRQAGPFLSVSPEAQQQGDEFNLIATTLIGGSAWDAVYAIETDSSGAIYIAGETPSEDFPVNSAIGNAAIRQSDVFVMKMSPDLTQTNYAIALGGGSIESVYGMAVENGIVYLTGETWSVDFPGGVLSKGESDVWVAAVAADGSGLIYSVRIGGIDQDRPGSLTVADGNVYLTGVTWSTDFPGGGYKGEGDVFIIKLNPDGSLAHSVLIGGANTDAGFSIDYQGGKILVCGQTWSRFFPIRGLKGLDDGFALQLDAELNLVSGVLLGGSAEDSVSTCAFGADGSILAAGETLSADFPFEVPASGTGQNGFVARISPDFVLEQVVKLGGSGDDRVLALGLAGDSLVWVTGSSQSNDFPTTGNAYQNQHQGQTDGFVTAYNPHDLVGGPVYSSFIGGDSNDYGQAVAVGLNGPVSVGGYTQSGNFPVTEGVNGTHLNGPQDGFVLRLGQGLEPEMLPTATAQPPIPTATPAPTLSEEQLNEMETAIPATALAITEQASGSPTQVETDPTLLDRTVTKEIQTETVVAVTPSTLNASENKTTVVTPVDVKSGGKIIFWAGGGLLLLILGILGWVIIIRKKKTHHAQGE